MIFLVAPISDAYSNTVPQSFENRDVVLVIDNSRSMRKLSRDPVKHFIDTISATRLAIVSFDAGAKLLHPLVDLSPSERQKGITSLNEMCFTQRFTDIASGLELALRELQNNWVADNSKTVLLISGGRIHLPATTGRKNAYMLRLRATILPNYERDNIMIDSIAFGRADLRFMQELAARTRAKCFVAPDHRALADILSVYASSFQIAPPKPVVNNSQEVLQAQVHPLSLTALYCMLSLVTVLAGTSVVLLVMSRRKEEPIVAARSSNQKLDEAETPTYVRLQDSAEQTEGLLSEAVSNLTSLKHGLEDYWTERYEAEKGLETRYFRLIRGLLLLLDYFEDALKEHGSPEVGWFHEQSQRLIEDEGLEVIPVSEGSVFDGRYHKYVDERPGNAPRGTIIEVTRKGYCTRNATGGSEVILRPAEVVISSGSPEG